MRMKKFEKQTPKLMASTVMPLREEAAADYLA